MSLFSPDVSLQVRYANWLCTKVARTPKAVEFSVIGSVSFTPGFSQVN